MAQDIRNSASKMIGTLDGKDSDECKAIVDGFVDSTVRSGLATPEELLNILAEETAKVADAKAAAWISGQ